jgi:hypothetical protein
MYIESMMEFIHVFLVECSFLPDIHYNKRYSLLLHNPNEPKAEKKRSAKRKGCNSLKSLSQNKSAKEKQLNNRSEQVNLLSKLLYLEVQTINRSCFITLLVSLAIEHRKQIVYNVR